MTDVLVIGVGSELRGDDGAGRDVVARVAALELPGVDVVSTIQLTPELAPVMAGRHVVFVDADPGVTTVVERPLDVPDGAGTPPSTTHHLDPPRLVALAASLDWAPAGASVVSVPAVDLRLGDHRSSTTRAAMPAAVATVVWACFRGAVSTTAGV